MFDAGAVAGRIKFDTSAWTAAKNKITQESAGLRGVFQNMAKDVGNSMRKAMADVGALKDKLAQHTATLKQNSLPLGFAATAVSGFIGAALKKAMDAQEALNLVQVSFKGSTDEILNWSRSVAASMGVGSNEIASMAGQLNLMINSMGLGSDAAKTMAKNLTKLTYDLASLRNLSIDEAFLKLKSGLTGETEPLKALGITLLETQVKAFAAANGIGELGRELTESEKVVARYGLILERTKEDQGDMARTWDSATNLSRAFGSQIKQLAVDVGTVFIPSFTQAMKVAGGFVSSLRTFVSEHPTFTAALVGTSVAAATTVLALGAMVPALAVVRAAYSAVAVVAGITYTVMLSGPALIVGAIAGIGVALYTLRAAFNQNVGLIRTGWNMLQQDLVDAWNKTGGALVGGFDAMRYAFTVANVSIANVAKTVANTVIGIWKSAAIGLRTLWDTWDPEAAFGAMKKAVLGTDYIGDVIGGLQVALSTYKPIIERGMAQTYEAVTLNLSEIGGAVTTQFGEDVDAFLATIRSKFPAVGKLIDDAMGIGRKPFEGYDAFDPKALLAGVQNIEAASAKAAEKLKEQADDLLNKLLPVQGALNTLREQYELLSKTGRLSDDAMVGMARESWGQIKDYSGDAINAIIDGAGKLNTKLGDFLNTERIKATAADVQKVMGEIAPPDLKMQDEILGIVERLKKGGAWNDDTANLLAASYWEDLKESSVGSLQAITDAVNSSGFTNAVERLYKKDQADKGVSVFRELAGIEARDEALQSIQQVGMAMGSLQAAGLVTGQTTSLFGEEFWSRFGFLGVDAIRAMMEQVQNLDPAVKAAIEKAIKTQEKEWAKASSDQSGWAGTAENIGAIGQALDRLGPKFQKAAQAAQVTQSAIKLAMSPDPVSLLVNGLNFAADAMGLFGDETEEVAKGMDRVMEEIGKSIEGWVDQFTDAILEFVKTGKFEFKEFVNSVLEDITRLIIKYAILEPLLGSLGISMTPNAMGNAFDKGNILPFARGGVVERPTAFPMAGRKVGVMGEAGPEAIMPLKRLANGRLGVSADGSAAANVEVTIVDMRTGSDPPVEVERSTRADGTPVIKALIRSQINEAIRDGSVDRTLGMTYGLRRRGA